MRDFFTAASYLMGLWLMTWSFSRQCANQSSMVSAICQDPLKALELSPQGHGQNCDTLKDSACYGKFYIAALAIFLVTLPMGFLILPLAGLPALWPLPYALLLVALPCLTGYFLFQDKCQTTIIAHRQALWIITSNIFAYLIFFSCLGILAYKKGIPGIPGGLDNFVAVPIWQACGIKGTIGLLIGLSGLLVFQPISHQGYYTESIEYLCKTTMKQTVSILWKILTSAVLVTIFLPHTPGLNAMPFTIGLGISLIIFALKIYCLNLIWSKLPKKTFGCILLIPASLLLLAEAFVSK